MIKNEKRIDFIISNFPIFSAFYLRNKGEFGSLLSLKSEWSCMTGWGFWNVGESDHWYAQTDLRAGVGYPPISFSFDGGLKKKKNDHKFSEASPIKNWNVFPPLFYLSWL